MANTADDSGGPGAVPVDMMELYIRCGCIRKKSIRRFNEKLWTPRLLAFRVESGPRVQSGHFARHGVEPG